MGSKEEKGEASEPKGAAEQLIGVLGLPDIVLGALALYALSSHFQRDVAKIVFPSTGFPWVDVALLACASAVIGKVVILLATVLAAIVDIVLWKSSWLDDYPRLKRVMTNYREMAGRTKANETTDAARDSAILDLALGYVALEQPTEAARLQKVEQSVVFAWGVEVVAFLYVARVWAAGDSFVRFLLVVGLFAIVALAVITQQSVITDAENALRAIATQPQPPPNEKEAGNR